MKICLIFAAALAIGYFMGCVHPSYILGKLVKHVDIREHGSNNSGASNSVLVLGFKYGVLTAVVDIAKGFLAAFVVTHFISAGSELAYAASSGAILGHMFPFYLNFRGGKGLATLLGFGFAVRPILGLSLCLLLVAAALLSDYIVVGTVCVSIAFMVFTAVVYGFSLPLAFALLVGGLILFKHRVNYKKIANGTETRISGLFKKKA